MHYFGILFKQREMFKRLDLSCPHSSFTHMVKKYLGSNNNIDCLVELTGEKKKFRTSKVFKRSKSQYTIFRDCFLLFYRKHRETYRKPLDTLQNIPSTCGRHLLIQQIHTFLYFRPKDRAGSRAQGHSKEEQEHPAPLELGSMSFYRS